MNNTEPDSKTERHLFYIYDVILSEAVEKNLFCREDGTQPIDHAQIYLAQALSPKEGPLPLCRVKKSKKTKDEVPVEEEFTYLRNDILESRGQVFLWRINNEKSTTVIQEDGLEPDGKTINYDRKKVGSYPYCYVIIDNRKTRSAGESIMMAIEKNSAFDSPQKLCDVLERYFNRYLNEYGLQARLSQRTHPSKIWDFCKARQGLGDSIQRISFCLPNQKKVALSNRICEEDRVGLIENMVQYGESTDAMQTTLQCDYNGANPDLLKKHTQDFVHIVRICKSVDYRLKVQFRDYGEYTCDERVAAIFPMDSELLRAFRNGEQKQVLAEEQSSLYDWCDYVRQKCKDYDTIFS